MNRSFRTLLTVAISYATFVGAVFFSMGANASEVGIPTFVPTSCGEVQMQTGTVRITQVCVGNEKPQFPSLPQVTAIDAVKFVAEDGSEETFKITQISDLLIRFESGAVQSNVFMRSPNGEKIAMKVIRMRDGSFHNATGAIRNSTFVIPTFTSY